jgi:hypothetical protein
MLGRRLFGSLLLTFTMLASSLLGSGTAVAADGRYVSAGAECVRVIDGTNGLPKVEVTIENHSALTLHVAYVRSLGSSRDSEPGLTGLRLEQPEIDSVIEVPDGESVALEAAWAGGDLKRSDAVVALVVTSAGAFLPSCEDKEPQKMTYDGAAPEGDRAEAEESARVGAATIGQLESWRAYPALYALLHPDAREAVPFETMACWYAGQFGPPVTKTTPTIFSTEIDKVSWEPWTWPVAGATYEESAAISYSQAIGTSKADAKSVNASMHMVRVDGIWRWFFGGSAEGVARLPTKCDLPATT